MLSLQKVNRNIQIKQYLFLIFIALILSRCASIQSPNGGPMDVTPPKMLKITPENFSVCFSAKEVRMDFDEYVMLKEMSRQLVISPLIPKQPDIKTKGKSIIIQFKDTLEKNTTYTFNFGTSIADNNEGNSIPDFRYVFSTGDKLDSLFIRGRVINASTLAPEKNISILLYTTDKDSLPLKDMPQYTGKTNDLGEFEINNLRSRPYKIIALKDINSNYLYDGTSEAIGFLEKTVLPDTIFIDKPDTTKKLKKDSLSLPKKDSLPLLKKDSLKTAKTDSIIPKKKHIINSYELRLFQEAQKKQRLVKYLPLQYGKVLFVFNIPTENPQITSLKDNLPCKWHLQEINKNRDSIVYWLLAPDMDTLFLQVKDNDIVLDTATIKLQPRKQDKDVRKGAKLGLYLNPNVKNKQIMEMNRKFVIDFNHPIDSTDFSKIIFRQDKDTLKPKVEFLDSVNRKLCISVKWKEGKNYNLFIPPGVFKDIFGFKNDTLKLEFKTNELRKYGRIKVKYKNTNVCSNFILQLIDEKGNTIETKDATAKNNFLFEYLLPGTYRLKTIYDCNNNGKWDTGDYLGKLQPEKITYLTTPINVRANWDNEVDWDVVIQPK